MLFNCAFDPILQLAIPLRQLFSISQAPRADDTGEPFLGRNSTSCPVWNLWLIGSLSPCDRSVDHLRQIFCSVLFHMTLAIASHSPSDLQSF